MLAPIMLSLALLAPAALPVSAPTVPNSAALQDSGRYRSSRNFDDTVEFFRKALDSDVRWNTIIHAPSVKAVNVTSRDQKTHWLGINIYEQRGEVRFYIIPRPKEPTNPAKSKQNKL